MLPTATDVLVVGESMSRALSGESAGILDEYAATSRRNAKRVVSLASRLTDLATASSHRRRIRNRAMRIAGKVPAVSRRLAWQLSGLDRR